MFQIRYGWLPQSYVQLYVEYYCKNSYDMVWVWVRWVSVQYCRFRTRKLSNMEMKNTNIAVLIIPFEFSSETSTFFLIVVYMFLKRA